MTMLWEKSAGKHTLVRVCMHACVHAGTERCTPHFSPFLTSARRAYCINGNAKCFIYQERVIPHIVWTANV